MVAPLPRYRYPVEPLLGLLAAGGLTTLVALAQRVVRRRAPARAELSGALERA
jgi:hypothetical protein